MASRVFINGRFLSQRVTGVQRYAREVLGALDDLVAKGAAGQLSFEVLAPAGTEAPPLRAIAFRAAGPLTGHAWEQLTLPALTGTELLYSFGPTGPLLKRNQVVTIHDASVFAVPQAFTWQFRTWYKLLLHVLARSARRVVTVSRFSAAELSRYLGCDQDDLLVTVEGWEHILRCPPDRSVLERNGLVPKRYVLAVSSMSPHKNFALIVEALKHLEGTPFDVAIAGESNPSVFGGAGIPSAASAKLLGYVSDGQLRALYENAGVFVYPSLYEGFGIPPLEAMALGCPVIASDAASLPEVCGEAALYVDPKDAPALAAAIRGLMADQDQRDRLTKQGFARVEHFSWTEAARSHLACVEACLSSSAGAASCPA